MPSVSLRHPYERFDVLWRRFKKAVDKADTFKDLHKHEAYEKPSEKRKREKCAAIKRTQAKLEEEKIYKHPWMKPKNKKKKKEREASTDPWATSKDRG